jgi:hypothetical protein
MEWRGKTPRSEDRDLPARLQEIEFAMEFEPVAHIEPFIKVEQVYTAAEQNVLAVIDDLGRLARGAGQRIRGRTPSQEGTRFKEFHLESCAPKGGGSRKSGEAAADDDDSRHSRESYTPEPALALGWHALPAPAATIIIDQADRNPKANRKKKQIRIIQFHTRIRNFISNTP